MTGRYPGQVRIALLIAASLLIAGCSSAPTGQPKHTGSSATSTAVVSSPGAAPPAAPTAGGSISDITTWIEAGHPVDAASYHSATRDGVRTELGGDIAFSADTLACMTQAQHTGTLVCLIDLAKPPPPPPTIYGAWKGGWVEYDGTNLQVGSAHADPGPFLTGNGAALAQGDSLSFGDFRCRSGQSGVFCVNYAHRSAVRLAGSGIDTFGCLRPVPAPDGVGERFSCSS